MQLTDFLRTVLPTQGNYYTVQITNQGIVRQFNHETIEASVDSLRQIKARHHNAFFATGAFRGKRTQGDCTTKRCWYVDIDCKPGKEYDSKALAAQALKEALIAGLPRPSIVVDSGNGYHLYWAIKDEVSKGTWEDWSHAIENACAVTGLKIDPTSTKDAARILRAPETLNQKNPDHPLPCKVVIEGKLFDFESFKKAFEKYKQATPTHKPSNVVPINQANPDMNSELWGGLQASKPSKTQDMIDQCPLFGEAVATGGQHHVEPLWRGLIKTLVYTDDGIDYIHKISDQHPDYDPAKVDKKYAEGLRTKSDNGPYLCATFAKNSNVCQTCPYYGNINSPIALAYGQKSLLPYPWRDGTYGVERYNSDDDEWEQVIPWRIGSVSIACDFGVATYVKFNMGDKTINTDMTQFGDPRTTNTLLAKYNRTMNQPHIQELTRLMNAWTKELEERKQSHPMVSSLGWTKDGFHYGGKIYNKDGSDTPAFIKDQNFHDTFSPHGDIGPWQQCANHILSQPRHAVWCILAAAFASPLVTFTGSVGAILSVVSRDTGTGKSTAMRVAQAVWGNPQGGMLAVDATDNAVAHRLGTLTHLPAYWDEVREKDEVQKFIKTIFRIAQGIEKQRLTSSIQERAVGKWELMLTVASNEAMRDHIEQVGGSSDAGMARVYEIYAAPIKDESMDDATARHFYSKASKNYGCAGAEYAAWLAQNEASAKDLVNKIEQGLAKALMTTSDERFWLTTMSTLLAGAFLANKIGICKFNVPELKTYLVEQFHEMRTVKKTKYEKPLDHSVSMVARFIHEFKDFTIKSDLMPMKGKRTYKIMRNAIKNPPSVRIAVTDKIIRVVQRDFEQWLYGQYGATVTHVMKDLTDQGMKRVRSSIDAGTDLGGGRQQCLDFPLTNQAFKKALGDLAD
jgi:hypothetical protein